MRWMWQEPWLQSVINFLFFASCIVLEAFSLPARGFRHRAKHTQHMQSLPGASVLSAALQRSGVECPVDLSVMAELFV